MRKERGRESLVCIVPMREREKVKERERDYASSPGFEEVQ